MIKYWSNFIFLLAFPLLCFTQSSERKGTLYFNVGPEYRITPIYDSQIALINQNSFLTNIDLQNSGIALNIGADFFITENFGVGFHNSFRYDLINTGENPIVPNQGVTESSKGLLVGYHFKLFYHFDVFKKGDLIFGAGLSLLNRNSEFNLEQELLDQNGQVVGSVSTLINYNYSTNRVYLGYGNGKSKFILGIYITRNAVYFNEPTTFINPFITFTYDFGKLKLKG